MIPHWPVQSTPLAACLATLAVELDAAQPYTKLLEEKTGKQTTHFLFRDASATTYRGKPIRTEEMITAWLERARFETEFPDHPMVYMRAANDMRDWFCRFVHGEEPLAKVVVPNGTIRWETCSISEAVILRTMGFPLVGFSGRAFSFPSVWSAFGTAHPPRHAQDVITQTRKADGKTPEQWMARFLGNLNHLLRFAKACPVTVTATDGERTLHLGADLADPKTKEHRRVRDQFLEVFEG